MTTSAWETLMATVLVGTDRRAYALPEDAGDLPRLLARVNVDSPEQGLLMALGAWALYRQVGQHPVAAGEPLPAPCPDESLPLCSAGAAQHLHALLNGTHGVALPEWLSVAAAHGCIAPPALTPTLLDMGVTRPDLHAGVRAVMGIRGAWLAERHTRWGYARDWRTRSRDEQTGIWENGTRDERLAILTLWRAQDPANARAQIERVWSEENAPMRAALVAVLRVSLSAEDEPFLERGLDDRSVDVRRAAVDVLAALPESDWRTRMEARARAAVSVGATRRGLLGRAGLTLSVTPPVACDAAMQRDGIEERAPQSRGQRAWWLIQMLGAVHPASLLPPGEWTPEHVLAQAAPLEWRMALIEGWARGAARFGDGIWAQALIRAILTAKDSLGLRPLLHVLTPEQRDDVYARLWRDAPALIPGEGVMRLLSEDDLPWSLALTRRVVQRVAEASERQRLNDPTNPIAHMLATGAPLAHPDAWDEAARLLEPARQQFTSVHNPIERFLSLLDFRAQMLKELSR